MSRPSLSSILVILIGGVILSAITVAGSTWILLLKVERVAINGTIRGTDTRIWRYLHNENLGVEWVLISDWGHDLVNGPGGFEEVPEWAAPRLAKSPTGKQRIGTIRAGWPMAWVGAWWESHRRDEAWPPLPFDEDLGYGIEEAASHLLRDRFEPQYLFWWEGLAVNLLVFAAGWWVVLSAAWYLIVRTREARNQATAS